MDVQGERSNGQEPMTALGEAVVGSDGTTVVAVKSPRW